MSQIETKSGQSKASLVTRYVNTIIQKLIDFAPVEERTLPPRRKKYAYLCVLGYNDGVSPLLGPNFVPVDIPTLADKSLGDVPSVREIRDRSGNVVRHLTEYLPVWITPKAEGNTDMAQAFEEAEKVVRNWLASPPEFISTEMGMQNPRKDCFPPVVINITDAKHNGNNDPDKAVERIRRLSTDNGNVLVCNCHFTHEDNEPCIFPSNIQEVRDRCHSQLAERMFEMSSVIPEVLRRQAEHFMRNPVPHGARCFVYNANPEILVKFLRWTTLGNAGVRIR
jgi:hypothetical protein